MPVSRDIAHRVKSVATLNPSARTGAVTGLTVDTVQGSEYEAAAFIIDFGAWTDGTHTIVLQDSADSITWNTLAIPQINIVPAVLLSAAAQNSVITVGYYGGNRYLRAITTVSGATTGAVYGVDVLLAYPHHQPAV